MAKDKISDYSSTANSNTDIAGINIDEGCAPSGINDAIRTLMAQLKTWQSGGQDVYITPAGSASAPAVTTTGDTNTGVFFPAADTVGITTGGTERARVDSAGNLGLGVTPSAWNSVYRSMQLGATGAISGRTDTTLLELAANAYRNSGGSFIYLTTDLAARYDIAAGVHRWYNAPSGTAGNAITFTQAMTLDASGKLGVGTTSPFSQLDVRSTNAGAEVYGGIFANDSTSASSRVSLSFVTGSDGTSGRIRSQIVGDSDGSNNGYLAFYTRNGGTNSERARIDSSGNLLVGATSTSGTPRLHIKGSSTSASDLNFFFINSAGSTVLAAYNNGALYADSMKSGAGTNAVKFSTSTGQITYDTSSARYKDNIRDSVYGLNHVMQMRSAQFEYKDDGRSDVGLIAEELDPIIPELVGKNKEGQPDSVSYDRMVSVLVKAVQEQQAIITALTARIEALEQA